MLGELFLEVFAVEVPRVVVAIAATAVMSILKPIIVMRLLYVQLKVILDKMVSSQAKVNFRVNMYSLIYLEILGLMKKCDSSMIHTEKTKALQIKWACQGTYILLDLVIQHILNSLAIVQWSLRLLGQHQPVLMSPLINSPLATVVPEFVMC